MSNAKEKSQLQVYVRIKPSSQSQEIQYEIDHLRRQLVIVSRPHHSSGYFREQAAFNFKDILDQDIEQEEIYEKVAKPVLQNFINAYNGTIFAYGQTGSGKTYTMSGSDQQQWQYRGIIPRVISGVFDEIDKKKGFDCRLSVSYMEIYNDNAYDLLDQRHLEEPPENWNKVQFQWDDEGGIHLKNITNHPISNEQEGFDKMIIGNFIKKMSSTPINYNSSRSHCVFTINLEATERNSGDTYFSKLHLVDLAGSERISKSHVDGNLLTEAKHINKSLSFLEQVGYLNQETMVFLKCVIDLFTNVIVALNDQSKKGTRVHIPYRNSIMTTVLKDSLGGNCLTVMIANISSDVENYDETISTLRFAQRVSKIENEVQKNQKFDIEKAYKQLLLENKTLQKKVDELEKQGDRRADERINFDEVDGQTANYVKQKVGKFLDESSSYLYIQDLAEAQLCFQAMKQLYNKTMQEYVDELLLISGKLNKYERLLKSKKQNRNQSKEKKYDEVDNSDQDLQDSRELSQHSYEEASEQQQVQQQNQNSQRKDHPQQKNSLLQQGSEQVESTQPMRPAQSQSSKLENTKIDSIDNRKPTLYEQLKQERGGNTNNVNSSSSSSRAPPRQVSGNTSNNNDPQIYSQYARQHSPNNEPPQIFNLYKATVQSNKPNS